MKTILSKHFHFERAVAFIKNRETATISGFQRYFKIGYNNAMNLMENLELHGVVHPINPSTGSRLVNKAYFAEQEKSHVRGFDAKAYALLQTAIAESQGDHKALAISVYDSINFLSGVLRGLTGDEYVSKALEKIKQNDIEIKLNIAD